MTDMMAVSLNCTSNYGRDPKEVCNNTNMSPEVQSRDYDSVGAMHFIIAVVIVYGVGVMGVFVLSHFRRMWMSNDNVDNQANYFIKRLPSKRDYLEKQQRLHSIQQILPDDKKYYERKNRMNSVGKGILKYIAIPMLATGVSNGTGNDLNTDVELGGTLSSEKTFVRSVSSTALEILKEADEVQTDDLEDDVFMNSCERTSFGVDVYIKE